MQNDGFIELKNLLFCRTPSTEIYAQTSVVPGWFQITIFTMYIHYKSLITVWQVKIVKFILGIFCSSLWYL